VQIRIEYLSPPNKNNKNKWWGSIS